MIKESVIYQLNQETQDHSKRVANICKSLAYDLSIDSNIAYKMGLYHDIGKIYIPSKIMKKQLKLTSLEREIIDLHAYYGYRLLKDAGEPSVIYLPVLFHHGYWKTKINVPEDEYMDENTIKYVYLLHSADVFDAMTSRRVYHKAFPVNEALKELSMDMMSTAQIIELLYNYAKENSIKIS